MVLDWYNFPSVIEIGSGKVVKDTWMPHASGIFQQIIQEPGGFLWGWILPFSVSSFFFNDVAIVLHCMGS